MIPDLIDVLEVCLGKPVYRKNQVVIYCCDCLEALRVLPPNIFDLTVTSPPYNIGKPYEEPVPLPEYVHWSAEWIAEVCRVTAPRGAFWLNLGYVSVPHKARAMPLPYLLWNHIPFFLVQEIVWNYGAGVAGKTFLSPRNEKWLWYVKDPKNYVFNLDPIRDPDILYPQQKKRGKLRCNTIGKNPSDVWQIAKVTSGTNRSASERTKHPAQFPLDLINRIVLGFSNEQNWLLDPFIGSGTLAISALNHGRKVVGFEIRKDYCEMAAERVDSHLASLNGYLAFK
jgi:adenine-specific DNA-methyltransferase